ncbi:MAG: ABC transporter substrate-binding protein [Oscillospiraceae bacterium]
MKRLVASVLSFVLAFALVACQAGAASSSAGNSTGSTGTSTAATGEDVVLGASIQLTGATPLDGERVKQALELVVKETNANGGVLGGRQLKLIVEDNQADQTQAINVANKLLSSGVVAVFGPHESTNAMAVQQMMGEAKIPFITGGTSPSLAKVGNEYMFMCRASDTIMARVAAAYATEQLGAKNVAIMYNNNEYGTGGQTTAQAYFDENGISYIAEGHNSGDKDMTAQLLKAKQAGCDTIFLWAHAAETVVLARQIYELDLGMKVVACPTPTLAQVTDLCETEWLEGWFAVTDYVPSSTEDYVVEFQQKFEAEYGVQPEMFAAAWYGAGLAMVDAIERAGSADPVAIQKALTEVDGLQGIVGTLSCDDTNSFVHEGKMVEIKDKQAVLMETVSA